MIVSAPHLREPLDLLEPPELLNPVLEIVCVNPELNHVPSPSDTYRVNFLSSIVSYYRPVCN